MAGWNEWVPGTNMTLSEVLDALKSASIGLDVKDKLYWSFFKVVQEAIKGGNANFDVEMAKGRFRDLASRLDFITDETLSKRDSSQKIEMGDLSPALKEDLADGMVAVVGEKSVARNSIDLDQIYYENTAFLETGKQLINEDKILYGRAWTGTGWVTNANRDTTDAIPAVQGQTHFTISGHPAGTIYYYFNAKYVAVASGNLDGQADKAIVAIPANSAYFRLIYPNDPMPKIIVARGQHTELVYEEYYEKLAYDDGRIDKISEDLNDIFKQSIESKRDQFKPKTYNAIIKNTANAGRVQSPVRLAVNFPFGEVKNAQCIVVERNGVEYQHQYEADRFANPKFDESIGYHADGSLKDGYLHILDDFTASESKEYEIKVYPQAVSATTDYFEVNTTGKALNVTSNHINFNLHADQNYLPTQLNIGGKVRKLGVRPSLRYNDESVYLHVNRSDTTYKFDYFNGPMFFDAITTLNFRDEFVFKTSTRIYKTGQVEVKQHVDILNTFTTSLVNQVLLRAYVSRFTTTNSSEVVAYEFTDGSEKYSYGIIQVGGDAPRGGGTPIPTLPSFESQVVVDTDTLEILGGWNQPTEGISVPKESQFMSTFYFDYSGYTDSLASEVARIFNPLKAQATTDAKLVTLGELEKNLKVYALHMLQDIKENPASSPFNPPIAGDLLRYELTSKGDLETLATQYISHLESLYGALTSANLWTQRQAGGVSLDIAGRLFPIAYKFYQLLDGDQRFADIITAYADMLASSVEASGWTGILLNALNANGCASGLRGLKIGLIISPGSNRYQDAYDTNLLTFKKFFRASNILVDGFQNLSTNNYLSYHLYAMYEYAKTGDEPVLDATAYVNTSTNSAGEILDLEYTLSSARRGLSLSSIYAIYLLTKSGSFSDLALAKVMTQKLVSDLNPSGGAPRILDGWWNPASSQYNDVVISFEVILSVIELINA